jgi:SAM-dependent methyltransferase
MRLTECRGCRGTQFETLINLEDSPVSNDFLQIDFDLTLEPVFPLEAIVCMDCAFVQLTQVLSREELFKPDYVYFSSYSKSWLSHCEDFAKKIQVEKNLTAQSLVVEIASNDGYLLQYFKSAGVGVLGVEPTAEPAAYAVANFGINTIVDFFGKDLAQSLSNDGQLADLIVGNNVLAHVPNIHDLISGVRLLLKKDGIATFEFPHITSLLAQTQFDTIYHEHYSYLGLTSLIPIFKKYELEIYKVDRLKTHGGSLRIYVRITDDALPVEKSVTDCLLDEANFDPRSAEVRNEFKNSVEIIRASLIEEIKKISRIGNVVAFGAAAKGNTLLNYCGLNSEDVLYIVDSNPHKQNLLAPGSHIPVVGLDDLRVSPDFILILPWNLKDEIVDFLKSTRLKDARMLVAIPRVMYVHQ